jgi:hypothetical protein
MFTDIFQMIAHIDVLSSTLVNGRIKSVGLDGPPGSGKTTILEGPFAQAWSKFAGKPVDVINDIVSTREPTDVRGLPLLDKRDPDMPAYRYGRPDLFQRIWLSPCFKDGLILLNLDEFTQADQSMQKVLADLIQNGRVGEYVLPSNVWVVATGNRLSDNAGVSRQLSMLTNRMAWYHLTLPIEHWAAHALDLDLPPLCRAFAVRFPDIFADRVPPREGAFCTNRSFTEFSQYLRTYIKVRGMSSTHVPDNIWARATAHGMIGEEIATRFFAYVKVADQLPSDEDILQRPESAKMPDEWAVDAQFAAVSMAMSLATRNILNIKPAVQYIMRAPTKELVVQALTTLNLSDKTRALTMNNFEVNQWLSENMALVGAVRR